MKRTEAQRQSHSTAAVGRGETDTATASTDQLLAEVSHDLRMPLTAISLFARAIEGDAKRMSIPEAAEIEGMAHRILEAVREGLAIVDDLIEVSQARAGMLPKLDLRPMDLTRLVEECIQGYQRSISDRHIYLMIPELVVGNWDARRLKRVVDNLLANAIKYSGPDTKILVRVFQRVAQGRRWAILTVLDSGAGIPATDGPSVFDWYSRGSNVDSRPGSGIGLASARRIVLLHGGSITVASREGVGSMFTVHLPMA